MKGKRKQIVLLCAGIVCLTFLVVWLSPKGPGTAAELQIEQYTPSNENYKDTVFAHSVQSKSSSEEDKAKNKIVLESLEEPLQLYFGQQGKKRTFVLNLYYDYLPIKFRVGNSEAFSESFVFDLDSNTGMNFEVYLDPDLPMDMQPHKLLVNFTSGYRVYAKDMETQTSEYGSTEILQLSFGKSEQGEPRTIPNPYSENEECTYIKRQTSGLILNTQEFDRNKPSTDVFYPEKNYIVKPNTKFNLNYFVADMNPSAETALIFLTVGHKMVDIDQQNYKCIPLKKEKTAVGQLSFITPSEPGTYDVMGYVVYNPFTINDSIVYCFPQKSVRFSIEVQ